MTERINRAWRLLKRPEGLVRTSDIALVPEQVPELKDGEVLIRHLYLALDPECRLYLRGEETFLPSVEVGQVLLGIGIGVIEQSRNREFQPGEIIRGFLGWQEYIVTKGDGLERIPRNTNLPSITYLTVLSHTGVMVYKGLLEIGKLRRGETLVVSSGAVGLLAGQIGKIHECRVVGIVANEEMNRWAKKELGFDEVVDSGNDSITETLRSACPDGIDIFFDTIGGQVLDTALKLINQKARIVLGGMISQYNSDWGSTLPGIPHLINLQFAQASIHGFNWLEYQSRNSDVLRTLTRWVVEGKLKYRVQAVYGIENALSAFNKNFDGSHNGYLICMVSENPE